MDPFIEASGLWGDFHQDLITAVKRELNQVLPRRYVARGAERTYVDTADPEEGARRHIEADIQVRTGTAPMAQPPTAATLVAPSAQGIEMEGVILEERREIFLEIFDLDRGRELVTCIEALSPSNKRPGSKGWELYTRKRHVFSCGHANFVEIDLLRGGRRMPMAGPWPSQPYYVLTLHKDRAPRSTVYPAHFREPLPAVPIPLRPPDKDIILDLQPIIDRIYIEARYVMDIDYNEPLRPPLEPADLSWLQERLGAQQQTP
jgi:hypothetical protein